MMMRRRWLVVMTGLVTTLSVVLFVLLWDQADRVAAALTALTGIAVAATPLLMSAMAAGSAGRVDGEIHTVVDKLADSVFQQLGGEPAEDQFPLRLRKSDQPDLSCRDSDVYRTDDQRVRWGRGFTTDSLTELLDEFELLPKRRLVLLGEAGAGKTALAVTLARQLLERCRRRTSDGPGSDHGGSGRPLPVPVLVPLAACDPGDVTGPLGNGSPQPLKTWLAQQLINRYGLALGPGRRRAWRNALHLVESGLVLPVLDELEAWDRAAPQLIHALGRSNLAAIVTSRPGEYQAAVTGTTDTGRYRSPMTGAAVVELLPVEPEQIREYLHRSTPPQHAAKWDAVFGHLRRQPDGPLANAFGVPLILWLACVEYAKRDRDPAELLDADRFDERDAIEVHLLHELVWGDDVDRRDADRVRRARRWLREVAGLTRQLGTKEIAWWELARAVPPKATGLVIGAVGGGITLLAVMCAGALARMTEAASTVGPTATVAIGVAVAVDIAVLGGVLGIVVGLLGGVAGWHAARRPPRPATLDWRSGWRPGPVIQRAGVGAGVGASAVGLALGLGAGVFGSEAMWELALAGVPIALPATSLMLVIRPGSATDTSRGDRPSHVLRSEAVSAGAGMVFAAVVAGMLAAFLLDLVVAPTDRPPVFVAAAAFGCGAAMIHGSRTAWVHFLVSRAWFALSGRLPWRLTRFLDEAYRDELRLLSRVGGVYLFRHALLRQQLSEGSQRRPAVSADAGRPGPSAAAPPVTPGPRPSRRWWDLAAVCAACLALAVVVGLVGRPSRTIRTAVCDPVVAGPPAVPAPAHPVLLRRTGCVLSASTDVFRNHLDKIDVDSGGPGRGGSRHLVGAARAGGAADVIVEYHRIRNAHDAPSYVVLPDDAQGDHQTCRSALRQASRRVRTIAHGTLRAGDSVCLFTDERRVALIRVVEPPVPPRPRLVADVTVWAERLAVDSSRPDQ
ncbi:hypothetical protein ACN27F_00160 [Solwaraspora sp. WMMB335]|uniref:hypothetical protein n=1 Tax=Solwaraspora sp. WMMB335 TaxID=3404118 RepID=UPI003B962E65